MPRQTPQRTYGKRGLKGRPKSYSDARRQSHLPPMLSTIRPRESATPTPSMRQQTLTQIDFVGRLPPNLDDVDLAYEQEGPEPSPRPAKRQKRADGWPSTPNVQPRSGQGCRVAAADARDKSRPKRESVAQPAMGNPNVGTTKSFMPPPKIPQKVIKREIPSSQSPEGSPSSMHSDRSARSMNANTSPLKDVSNIRSTAQPHPLKRARLQKPASKSAQHVPLKAESQDATQTPKAWGQASSKFAALEDKENRPPHLDQTEPVVPDIGERDVPSRPEPILAPFIPDSEDEGSESSLEHDQPVLQVDETAGREEAEILIALDTPRPVTSPRQELCQEDSGFNGEVSLQNADATLPTPRGRASKPQTPARSSSNSSRASRTSQSVAHSFIPVLETETQAQAAFQPFSPSMLLRRSRPNTQTQGRMSNTDTQPALPPPKLNVETQQSLPPCPTSQAETIVPTCQSPSHRKSTTAPATSGRTAKQQTGRDVVVIPSSSPAKGGDGHPSWDWSAIPDSQLLPDSIMNFVPKWPSGSQESLRSERLEEG